MRGGEYDEDYQGVRERRDFCTHTLLSLEWVPEADRMHNMEDSLFSHCLTEHSECLKGEGGMVTSFFLSQGQW